MIRAQRIRTGDWWPRDRRNDLVSCPAAELSPVAFGSLTGFDADDLDEAFAVFRRSAERLIAGLPAQRPACPPSAGLIRAARAAMTWQMTGGSFFRHWFRPFRISKPGFVTAYYEPVFDARLTRQPGFETPALARPADLATLNDRPLILPSGERLTAARRAADGALSPCRRRRSRRRPWSTCRTRRASSASRPGGCRSC